MRRTVFISSTFQDLQTHRKAVWNVLGNFDVAVRGMEQFGARKESPLETCLLELEQSDVYIGIIAFRHGSVEPKTEKSYTQIEYERAAQLGKEVLIYLIDEENSKMSIKYIDKGSAREKLEAFKATLRERHTIDTFLNEEDLAVKLQRDLMRMLHPRESRVDDPDEFVAANNLLSQFLLLPKSVAGSEVRVRLRPTGNPYPASRIACEEFNFTFGATIGVPVSIIDPSKMRGNEAFDLFVDQKLALNLLPINAGNLINCYVRLHFSEKEISDRRARFNTRVSFPLERSFAFAAFGEEYKERIVHKADSAIALELSKLVDIERTTSEERPIHSL